MPKYMRAPSPAEGRRMRIPPGGTEYQNVYVPDEHDRKLITFAEQELQDIEGASGELRKVIQKCRQNYLNKFRNPVASSGRTKVFVPLTQEKVDAIAPKTTIDARAMVVEPLNEEAIPKAVVMEQVVRNQARQMRFFEMLINERIRSLGIDGTIVLKAYWDFSKNRPACYFPDLLDVFVNPEVSCLAEAPIVMERFRVSVYDLKHQPEYKGMYKNLEYVYGKTVDTSDTYDSRSTRAFDIGNTSTTSQLPFVDLYECWTPEQVFTIAQGDCTVLIRDDKNKTGVIPYFEDWYEKLGRRWYGLGVAEKLIDLQRWINVLVNQRIANREIILNKMFIVKTGVIKDIRQLTTRPGGFIEAQNPQTDIKPLEFSDITAASYRDEDNIYSMAERTTGSYEIGQGGGQSRTATDALVKSRAIEGRFNMVKTGLEDFSKRVFDYVLLLNKMYLDKKTVLRVVGSEEEIARLDDMMGIKGMESEKMGKNRFLDISNPELLSGNMEVYVNFDDTVIADRAVRAKQLLDMLAIATNDPNQPLTPEDRKKIYREFMRLQGIKVQLEGLSKSSTAVNPLATMIGQPGGAPMPSIGSAPRPSNGGTQTDASMNGYSARVPVTNL